MMPVSGFAEQVLETADAETEESLFPDESVQEEEDNDISEEQDWEENDENADPVVIEKNYQIYPNIPEDMQDVCGVNISTSSDDSVNVEVNIVDQKNKHYLIKSIRIGSKVLLNNPGGQLSYAENDIQITDDIADENGNVPVTIEGMERYTIEISYDSEKGQAYIEGREEEEYGTIEVSEGEIPKLIVHAHEDYLISDILIDDESLEDCQDLTDYDTELTADKNHVIQVSFVSKQHKVTSNLEDEQKGGSVNFRIDGTEEFMPSLSIEHGQNVTGRVQANNGYFISGVSIFSDKPTRNLKVEDMEKDANGGYLFDISDITGDITVTAYFFEFPNVQLTLPDKDMNYSCYNSQVILTLNSNNLTYFSSGKYWIDGSEEIHELNMQERTIEITEDGQNIVVCAELFTGNGQSIIIRSESFSINSVEPEVIININGDQNSDAKDKYYCSSRTASIRIKDRKDTFPSVEKMLSYFTIQKNGEYLSDEEKAEIIQYNPDDTFDLDGRDGIDIFVTFEGDASYSWDFEYINLAGKKGKNNSTESKDVYEFFIDTTKPKGTITIGEQPSVERFISMITFGLFFSNSAEDITITSEDTSPVKIEYYIRQGEFTNGITSDELEQDSETFWTEYTGSFSFTPQKKAKFVVYVRMIDAAGNREYVSSNGYIFDEKKSTIKLEFDGIDESVIYTENISVKLHVTDEPEENETVSGIKKVEYWLTTVESEEEITPEVLYSREDGEALIFEKKFEFEVKANIDSIVELHVRAEDNAGNIEEEIKVLNIDPAPPEISVTYYYEDETGNRVNIDGGAYFDGERITVISIKERNFNQNQALDGITITSDLAGENKSNSIVLSDAQFELEANPELKLGWLWETAETKWKKTGKDTYETTIIFSEDGTYKLNVDYEDNAGNHAEKNLEFTIDSIKPVGSVIINDNSQKMANQLLKKITFGIFSNQTLTIEIKADSKKNTENKINIEYYLSQIQIGEEKQPLTFEELEAIEEWTAYAGKFSINKDENYSNVVYARLADMAGNVSYICSEGYIYDDTSCKITITPDKTNAVIRYDGTEEYAYYHEDFTVDMEVNDYFPYSGIAYVKYALKVNGETVQSEEFFRGELDEETGKFLPTDEITEIDRNKKCDEPWQQQILISKSYNSSNIELTVETKDFAGNEKIETFPFDIDTTAPEVEISYDNNTGNVFEGEWYFQNARTAVIQFTERREHFNRKEAQKSISVTGAAGTYQFGDWTFTEGKAQNHDDDVFSIPVTFYGDSEYQIRIDYSDMAQNHNSEVSIGKNTVAPYAFMVDRTSPYGTITALSAEGREETWDDIVDRLYFGFWSKYGIQIFIEYGDASSPVKSVEYYKSLATNALTEEEIIKIKDWETFDTLTLSNNERCTIYLKITDAAGNSRYLSTHALIIDDSLPDGELMPPDISMTAEQAESGIYNRDVSVSITVDDPMVNNAYSGLQSVSYRVLNMGQETQSGTLYTFNIDDPQYNDLLKTWEGEVTVSGELNNSNDVVLEVYAQDNVLNASVETLSLSIDTTPPSISVSFNNNQVQNELFKDGRTARISIAERNFSKEYVNIVTTKDGVEYQASAVWEQSGGTGNGDNTVWYTDLPFSGDGDYTFSIDCSDLAANKSSQVIYVDGTVLPSEFTIDATIPDIKVEFIDKDSTPKGNYYKDERTATITIDELHFNKEKASSGITVRGTDDGKSVNAVI
ncbi:MAG: hypothetical protein K2O42_04670, partial [Oscillospiraceae bacterium]|nr:hypothetical protein [Oscillospiraceae bacterium]